MPAKSIDPATGASTWALGNQICTKNIGVFTIKAIVKIATTNSFLKFLKSFVKIDNESWLVIINISRGRDVITVYMIK